METKIYSSAGFSHQYSAEELYVLASHWLSDTLFFAQEISYFQFLLRSFFNASTASAIESIEKKLNELTIRNEQIKETILKHQNSLSAILDKNKNDNQLYFNTLQSTLEGEILDFIKTFRLIKKELFKATQHSELMQNAKKISA